MKTKIYSLIVFFSMSFTAFSQGIGVNETGGTPHPSSALDVSSSNKGFLPPRMTLEQRNAISNPADGLMIFNLTTNCPNYYNNGKWFSWCGVLPIANLDCANVSLFGIVESGAPTNNATATISYENGNGEAHTGQVVSSIGVTGLTATLAPGNFAEGSGSLVYTITGTPDSHGVATFNINIGQNTCTMEIPVIPPFVCGTTTVSFTYNGSNVTYGTVPSGNGRCWLDRNLGATAVATTQTSANALGHTFQWGRADDGHQVRTSPTTTTLATSDQPGNNLYVRLSALATNNGDWRSDNNNGRWAADPMVNNPCPAGWIVPSEAEWASEIASWSTPNNAGAWSALKLTIGGRRQFTGTNPGIINTDYGMYTTRDISSDDPTQTRYLFFQNTGGNAAFATTQRAYGLAVRCIRMQ